VIRSVVASGSAVARTLAALAITCLGCGSGRWYLHPQGGDQFGVVPSDPSGPSSIECPGTTDGRFACFVEKLRERSGGRTGVFAVVTSEGRIQSAMTTGKDQPASLSDDTPFPLGSITKMFVAATAVSLEQEGMLDLTQPIARYLPELGADSELGKVTLHELLTHTSGIMDPADSPLCVGDGTLESVLARARLAAPAGAVYVEDFSAFIGWSPSRRFGSVAFVNAPGVAPMVAVLRGMSVFLDISPDWKPREDASHALASYAGIYSDPRGGLGRVRVSLEGEHLAYDYPDGAPRLVPAWFRFQFKPDSARARYVVTPVGVGERVGE
jgi:hypothetical protein